MNRRHAVAVVVALLTMAAALVPPFWIRATGDEVALPITPVDPLSLFRGNYVDLRYDVDVDLGPTVDWDDVVYVVFDDGRPARALRSSTDRPTLGAGERCIRGRAEGRGVAFPELEQFFVTEERGRELERELSQYVAIVKATESCRAVLVDLEPR